MSDKESKGNYFMRERHFGNFYRRVVLPDYVDTTKHDAVLEHGVLKVVFQRKDPSKAGTQITPITFGARQK